MANKLDLIELLESLKQLLPEQYHMDWVLNKNPTGKDILDLADMLLNEKNIEIEQNKIFLIHQISIRIIYYLFEEYRQEKIDDKVVAEKITPEQANEIKVALRVLTESQEEIKLLTSTKTERELVKLKFGQQRYLAEHINILYKYDIHIPVLKIPYGFLIGLKLLGINLNEVDLSYATLIKGDFGGGNLKEGNFKYANLHQANFHQAYLQRGQFQHANLAESDLREVHLELADLSDSCLENADLDGAVLKFANFQNADMTNAYLQNADLSEALNLTKQQILSAQWLRLYRGCSPPKLPRYISVIKFRGVDVKDDDIQQWLANPTE